MRAIERSRRLAGPPGATLAAVVAARAAEHGDAPALIGEPSALSYAALTRRAGQVGHWAIGQGLAPGAVVALLMPNRPDYVAIWLGLSQVGCVVALLNTNLAADALAHCIRAAAARHVIVDAALAARRGSTCRACSGWLRTAWPPTRMRRRPRRARRRTGGRC